MRLFLTAITAILLLASCGKMKKPELVGIDDVKVGLNKITAGKTSVMVYVRFFNPNSFTASLKHAEGEAWIDSSYVGTFTVDSSLKIAPKTEFVVPVNLSVKLTDLAFVSLAFAQKKEKEVLLKVTGTIRAGRGGFYKNIPVNYEGKQDLEKLISKGKKEENKM